MVRMVGGEDSLSLLVQVAGSKNKVWLTTLSGPNPTIRATSMDAFERYAHLHDNFKEMKGWKIFFEDNQQFEVEGIEGHDEYEPRAGEKEMRLKLR